jgi:hypothetical protein
MRILEEVYRMRGVTNEEMKRAIRGACCLYYLYHNFPESKIGFEDYRGDFVWRMEIPLSRALDLLRAGALKRYILFHKERSIRKHMGGGISIDTPGGYIGGKDE